MAIACSNEEIFKKQANVFVQTFNAIFPILTNAD
jgi:hypothetical protein